MRQKKHKNFTINMRRNNKNIYKKNPCNTKTDQEMKLK